MQLHQINPTLKKKSRKRVGRGGKKGTYSGRGMKGQKSRSGKGPRAGFAGGDTTLLKRLPKKRGIVGKVEIKRGPKLSRLRINPVVLNLKDIKDNFKDGEVVSPKSLFEKKLISKINKKIPIVKILGEGELKGKLIFKGVKISKKVKEGAGEKKSEIKEKKKKKRTRRKLKKVKEVIVKKQDTKKEDKKKESVKKEKPDKKEIKKENNKKEAK